MSDQKKFDAKGRPAMKPMATEDRKQKPVNATAEDAYWRDHHKNRPYTAGDSYESWKPAFQYGWEAYDRNPGKKFEEVEVALKAGWATRDDARTMKWDRAMHATRDAWYHLEHGARGSIAIM